MAEKSIWKQSLCFMNLESFGYQNLKLLNLLLCFLSSLIFIVGWSVYFPFVFCRLISFGFKKIIERNWNSNQISPEIIILEISYRFTVTSDSFNFWANFLSVWFPRTCGKRLKLKFGLWCLVVNWFDCLQ